MIRDATSEDKEQIMQLIKEFYAEVLDPFGFHYNEEKLSKDFDMCINNPNIIALVSENDRIEGFIAVIKAVRPFMGDYSAQELVWYVRERKRRDGIRLLWEIEKRCAEAGCTNIIMIGMVDTKAEEIYEKLGYRRLETNFIKKLRRE